MKVTRRDDHTVRLFLKRTLSAQLHALGCMFMLAASFYLLPLASSHGPAHFWGCAAFLATGFLVFLASTVYHFLSDGYECSPELTRLLDNLDHFGIYLFIAGSYTPVLLNLVAEPWCTPLVIGIWAIALVGILYTWMKPRLPAYLRSRVFSTCLFLLMGWFFVVRASEIFAGMDATKITFLVLGGAAYSIGAVVYAFRRPILFEGFFSHHELWHVLVLCGAGLHFALIRSFY